MKVKVKMIVEKGWLVEWVISANKIEMGIPSGQVKVKVNM